MTYGIEVFNDNINFQFGTTAEQGLTILTSGSVNHNANVTLNTNNQILCVRRANTGFILGTTTPGTSGRWNNQSGVTIDYIIMEKMLTRAPDDTGGYGIEIYNTSNQITFSSKYTRGQRLLSVYPPGTLSSASDTINAHPIVYTGNLTTPKLIYFGFGRMVQDLASTPFHMLEQAYFDYTNGYIRCKNVAGYPGPFGTGTIYLTYANKSSIIIMSRN
jgi:hypothetical protein